jgi:cobyrinic acid a,c-diamide synthase
VAALAQAVAAGVDLQAVLALAQAAPALDSTLPEPTPLQRRGEGLRIGIARGAAFGFYYPDDLAALQAHGATLVPIDMLADRTLPAIDGLFIGGGFPEVYMAELEANRPLRAALRQAIVAGLPVQAECGGLMLLARSLRWGTRCAEMVGAIPGDVVMHPRPVGRGYVQLQTTPDCPWGRPATALRGHEFHHSSLENLPADTRFAYRVQRGHGITGQHDGLRVHNLLASYAHLRDGAGALWVAPFLQFVRRCGEARHQAAPVALAA